MRLALRGTTTGAPPSEYNLSGGKLTVTELRVAEGAADPLSQGIFRQTGGEVNVGGNFWLSGNQGRGEYLMQGGTLNVNGGGTGTFQVSDRGALNPTYHQTGGTVTMTNLGVSRIAWGGSNAVGTMILEKGSFSFASNNSYFAVADTNSSVQGTLIKYGAADVSFSTSSTSERALQISRSNGVGTLRAVIDQTGFDAIRLNSGGIALDVGGSSTLQVALNGGVMLSGTDTFQIVNVQTGSVTGTWQNTPTALWSQTTGSGGVSVTLDSNDLRGNLDASTIGSTIDLTTVSSVGYITLANVNPVNPLLLRLAMDPDSVGTSNLGDFISDLTTAGYSPSPFGSFGVDITFDPTLNGASYFAWDLRDYTSSPALELASITVIPEPGAALLGGLGLLMLLRRRR